MIQYLMSIQTCIVWFLSFVNRKAESILKGMFRENIATTEDQIQVA